MRQSTTSSAAIIGAGLGGLATALRLAHAGLRVDVFDQNRSAGGKMRVLPTQAGPVDAGPTVLTLRNVFENLFSEIGETLSDHVTLHKQDLLARHYWKDSEPLDLFANHDRSREAINAFSGSRSAREFDAFSARTKALFTAFDDPVMQSPSPNMARLAATTIGSPALIRAMSPLRTLAQDLGKQFSDPRLAQLFGRYATYVGGSPLASPAILSLIWQAEASGVWQIEGGMQNLAQAMKTLAERKGTRFHFETPVSEILTDRTRATGVRLATGDKVHADVVVFNGDPAALIDGHLGEGTAHAVPGSAATPRSHAAHVWSFAAKPDGRDLALHTVFFSDDSKSEFEQIAKGAIPGDPTLYVYAQDRGAGLPSGDERFEIIMNAAPIHANHAGSDALDIKEFETCRTRTFGTLKAHGLTFSKEPGREALTTPRQFNALCPASGGSLYGRSPHGMMATFKRPTARSRIKRLYLAGGGCHPGAGIPMATLSGKHAAEAILSDLTSTSMSRQTAMHGGMSTASPTMATTPSRSSGS